jgi:formyl-CoA transferase
MEKAEFYAEARRDLTGPLAGVRVLDVTKVWSGPMTGCVLADLGCDVIRVEMPGNREGRVPPEIPGTGLSWFRQSVNRNKRSVGLDFRVPQAREVMLDLVRTADIVVENYKPGTLDRWGLGYRGCREVKPDIVYVSISGWGQFGPDHDRPGYDPVAQAAAGWMALNGTPDGTPVRAPTFLADDLAGLHGAIGAMAALRHRDHTGEGQHVDVSLLDSLLFQSSGFLTLGATGVDPGRWGDETASIVPANSYACSDGRIYLAVPLDKHWRALTELMDQPDLGTAPGFARNRDRLANREEVNKVIAQWCETRTVSEVVDRLDAVGITVAKVRTFGEAAGDPHVLDRDMLVDTVLCNGTSAPLVGPPVKLSRTPTDVRTGAPEPGAHTDELLAEIGLDATARARLREAGAI